MTEPREDQQNRIDLHAVFADQEKILLAELTSGKHAGHPGVQGAATERHWIDFMRKRLPRRYDATRAIIVDSLGQRSEQMDLIICDRYCSPQWWELDDHYYVPAESVCAAFEVKPEINRDYVLYASKKIASVRRLRRTATSFTVATGVQDPKPRLLHILGGLVAGTSGWSPTFGDPFRSALGDTVPDGALDLGCVLHHGAFEVPDSSKRSDTVVSNPDVALVSFLLTLLHRLQGLGNAPAIDYRAYERWISGKPK